MWIKRVLRKPDDGGEGGGAEGAPPAAPPAAPPPPAAAPPAAGAAPPAAAAAPAPPAVEETKAIWPDNWRETVSKGDAKVLAKMSRYASPEAVADALISAQNRISSGELKPVLGKNATPEQVAEWRTANGVPEKPDGYDLGKDVKLSDAGKAFLEKYLPVAHENNMTPAQVKASLTFIGQTNQAAEAARAEQDLQLQQDGEELLREEWGAEFKRNTTFIHNLLDGVATPEFKESLLGGRLADGTPIGSSPAALRFLMQLALVQNPAGTLVPSFNADPMKGLDDEIAKIETLMRTDRKAYNKDEAGQARYRELLEAREKIKTRA